MQTINQLVNKVHTTAKSKGWWEKPRTMSAILMLIVSEIAEACESVRNGEPYLHFGLLNESPASQDVPFGENQNGKRYALKPWGDHQKPEGEAIEFIDAQIRIMDYFGYKGWNLEETLNEAFPEVKDAIECDIARQDALACQMYVVKSLGIADIEDCEKQSQESMAIAYYKIQAIFEKNGWNWQEMMEAKMNYNETRSYRHGGKLA